MRFKLLLLAFFAILFSCKQENESTSIKRPNDPWVFRSVLDWKPRVVTLALNQDLWAAYSTNNCGLYKAWQGMVYFDGPVYTHAHGPQPISIGNGYEVQDDINPWFFLSSKGDTLQANPIYKGHKFVGNKAVLMYELFSADKSKKVYIEENPEVRKGNEGGLIFQRHFDVKGLNGLKLGMKQKVSSIAVKENIKTKGGNFEVKNTSSRKIGTTDKSTLDIVGNLFLVEGGNDYDITFMNEPTIINTNAAGEDKAEDNEESFGAKMIAKSDCKTCHNKTLKTVGPAYTEIAEKYQNNETNTRYLMQKVKAGGSGVWGNVPMTAHADLPDEDLKQMVNYILSLRKSGDSKKEKVVEIPNYKHDSKIDTNKLLPGAVTKVYLLPKTTQKVPSAASLKNPKYAGVKNNFDNIDGQEFAGLEDNFGVYADGYLKIDKPGEYNMEIWSDDGSKLYLHDQLLIDNDGAHGTEGKFGKVNLEKGYHPFRLEYYQGGGGKYLSLDWTKPGDDKAEVIPIANIFHRSDDQSFDGYSLPMANVSSIPGNKSVLVDVHPAFTLTQARPNDFEPKVGGMDFKKDGSLILSTWDPQGSVWKLENVASGDPSKIKVKKIASGLAEPLGVKVVDDTIFVMQKQEMTKLVDTNGDDIIDEYLTLCDDWQVSSNFHEFGFGLEYKDGYFYATLATAINPGGASTKPQLKDRGRVIKVNRKTGELEFIAHGLRTPNGIGIGYKGEIFVADNQGDWLPSSKILHVTKDAWFGSRSVDSVGTLSLKEMPPVVWLPQDEIGNSPSTPSYIDVGPYKGQMIHGEVTHGGIKRVFVEEVNGVLQGCVFRFIQGLEAGINRIKWGPDGALYVGGIGNPGNWGQAGKKWFGLQRLQYNNKSVFEMLAVRAKSNGVEIEFTEPLAVGEGLVPSSYEVKQWYYQPTINYGGPKLDEKYLKVKSVTLSDDRKKAFLELDGMKAGHVVYVRLHEGMISALGNDLWSAEAWYTLNAIPKEAGVVMKSNETFADNTLTEAERKEGWQLLFDGKKIDHFRNFNKKTIGSGWVIKDNAIHLNAVKEAGKWQAKDAGDIITDEAYQDFEFRIDWKITNCGNSGIIFNVVEDKKYDYVWQTGPEMQVLDNTCHPDTRFVTHRAGDLYDLIASKFPCSKPAGEWNKVRIISKGGKVDFYLNGYKTVSFTMHTKEWNQMIAKSKFKDMKDFGQAKSGHISLQDHGDKVWFKNIKIKKL